MPHLRPRHLANLVQKLRAHSPVIGILGHRQVGKTTLLEQLTQRYFSLDSRKELLEAEDDPEAYIENRSQGWVALDECQNVPDLFPAIKERIRTSKGKPGQFLLSGSIRFTGNPRIRESLTGRIANLELLPLTIAEIEGVEASSAFSTLLESNHFEKSRLEELFFLDNKTYQNRLKNLTLFLEQGGLPGICFIREPKIRSERIHSSLETILDRDLRQIVRTNLPYQTIFGLVKTLASNMDIPLDFVNLSKQTDISRPTLKKLVYALENLFILRLMKIEGARKGFGYFFEDIAESNFLSKGSLSYETQLAHVLWMNARAALSYKLGNPHHFFHFYSRSGKMSFCIEKENSLLGILCLREERPNRQELGIADTFLKHYKNSKVCYVHSDASIHVISPRVAILPPTALI